MGTHDWTGKKVFYTRSLHNLGDKAGKESSALMTVRDWETDLSFFPSVIQKLHDVYMYSHLNTLYFLKPDLSDCRHSKECAYLKIET